MEDSGIRREGNVYSLFGEESSYSLGIYRERWPLHLYWGRRAELSSASAQPRKSSRGYMIDTEPEADPYTGPFHIEEQLCEYGFGGRGDFRTPSCSLRDVNGYPISGPFDVSVNVLDGTPPHTGLPSARSLENERVETLELRMRDGRSGLELSLYYRMLPGCDALLRSAVYRNRGDAPVTLERAMSSCVDMPAASSTPPLSTTPQHAGSGMRGGEWELIYLQGAWARERYIERAPVKPGLFRIGSTRGTSSHQFNPFLALASPNTDEHRGEVYGMALIYSGNFAAEAECSFDGSVRLQMGIQPETFTWYLEPGEELTTPEAVMIYSPEGLNGLSRRYHRFVRERIFPPEFRRQERPVLFNNWEATYFDFDEERLHSLAGEAAELGIELFVLDDGWFGERDSDETSLGDWQVNRGKLPGGLSGLGRRIEELGMDFGLWVEPEMVSPKSELYRRHPDWCISVPGREPAQGRNQLVLDLGREVVRSFIVDTLTEILSTAPVSYLKWDMNRNLTDTASAALPAERQGEVAHRYVLGLYAVLGRIRDAFPNLLMEGCAGGGGRFDMGMLYYMPQFWTSDNTDAVSRLKIQYGTSLVYPPVSMGAHVSAVPNHQVGRSTPLETRANVAFGGVFGYELDISILGEEEKERIREQIAWYRMHRRLIQFGDFIRLASPFDSNEAAWMFLSERRDEVLVFHFTLLREANTAPNLLRVEGLPKGRKYREEESGRVYGSEELMYRGLPLPAARHDFDSRRVYLYEIQGRGSA